MYAPSDHADDLSNLRRDVIPGPDVAPAPIRWAGPTMPGGQALSPIEPAPQPHPAAIYTPVPLRAPATPSSATRPGMLLSIGSFLLSVALYAALFELPLGLGITVLLLIHELGHYIIIRAKGLPASLPVFIPLIGAYVAMRRWPASVRDDAEIALAGPLAGCASALGCIALFQATGVGLFLRLASLGYLLNLLNLVPILPLDGGRVANAISPVLGPLAFVVIVGFAIETQNITLLVVAVIFGLPALVRSLSTSRRASFFRISLFARLYLAVAYLLLAAIMFFGLLATLT